MGIKLHRKKKRTLLLSFIYRMNKLLVFISPKNKLRLFLDLEWIFDRLAHEETEKIYPPSENPLRTYSINFIKKRINENSIVCDMGCKYGHMSYLLADIAKEVVGIDYDLSAINIANKNYQKNKHNCKR